MLGGADDLVLSSISAFSATSRALVSGDIEGTQSSTASNAFHEGAFERLYFKGQTIRLINERLSNKNGLDLMDPSLFAGISALIFVEVRNRETTHSIVEVQYASKLRDIGCFTRPSAFQ
jgi:hypothetical protein